MVFIDAGAAHRIQHDINQVYEAIARLLVKIHLESCLQQPEVVPQVDVEGEEEQKQALLKEHPTPALRGQPTPLILEGQPERLRLEGRDFAALPYRDLEPLPLFPRSPLTLDPAEATVLVQLGDAVIERPLKLLPEALEEFQPAQIASLRQALEYPVGLKRSLPADIPIRIEVERIERFSIADGQIEVNDLYPQIVNIQAEAIATGRESATPEQVEDLSRYLLQRYTSEQIDEQHSFMIRNPQQIIVTEHPEQGIVLDFGDHQTNLKQLPADPTTDLNTVYQLLHEELERQEQQSTLKSKTEQAAVSESPEIQSNSVKSAEGDHTGLNLDSLLLYPKGDSQQHLPEGTARQPEMQLRPISEVEATTGQQLGNVEALHHEVLSEAPVVLVSVDDLGRPMVTNSVVAHVEVTEDEVETEKIEQAVELSIQEEQRMDLPALNQLRFFFDQTGARELESPETGMVIQPQAASLVASTPEGRVLILNGDRVQTNFTPTEIQQLGEMAQEAARALAANEISIGTVQQFNTEMERG
jgi:hypothetical protein